MFVFVKCLFVDVAGRLADVHREGAYRVDAFTGEKNYIDGGGK